MASAVTDGAKWTWLVEKDTYLLTLKNLPADLKLDDFVVRVDGKRRLTITDRHKPTPGKAQRLNKTFRFQLPKTANADAIIGCLDGAVLTLTVPSVRKGPQQPAASGAAAAKEETKAKAELERELVETAVAAKEEEANAKAEREKEVIDTAVAAFTLGVLFSHRLFSSRN